MPRFDAGELVEALDYTFRPYYTGPQCEGTVPEPSDKQVGKFLHGLKDTMSEAARLTELTAEAENDPAVMLDALNQLTGDEFVKIMEQMCDMFGDLCSGKPSGATLRKVPIRPRRLFFEWVQQEVLNPEGSPGAGTGELTTSDAATGG